MLCQMLTKQQRVPCKGARPFHWQRWHPMTVNNGLGQPFSPVGVKWQAAQMFGDKIDPPGNGLVGTSTDSLYSSADQQMAAEPVPNGMSALVWVSAAVAIDENKADKGTSDMWPDWFRWSAMVDGAVQGPAWMLLGCVRGEWKGHLDNSVEPYIRYDQWGGLQVDGELPIPLLLTAGQRLEVSILSAFLYPTPISRPQCVTMRFRVHGWWWHGDERGCGCGC